MKVIVLPIILLLSYHIDVSSSFIIPSFPYSSSSSSHVKLPSKTTFTSSSSFSSSYSYSCRNVLAQKKVRRILTHISNNNNNNNNKSLDKNNMKNLKKSKILTTSKSSLNQISKHIKTTMVMFMMMMGIVFGGTGLVNHIPYASANDSRLVGEIKGSGIVFKDTLNVESFDDPKVKGITLYISNFQRPLADRLQKDFFSDPSFASVGCVKSGPVQIASNIAEGKEGEEVFEESKSLLFKTLRVQRIYDKEKNTIVYVSFNTRLDKGNDSNKSRFKSATCAVHLD